MSGIFRNPTDGAQAKRLDLLRQRREELVTTPHVVRRVVVARSARIAASIAICIGGAVTLAAAVSPEFADWLAGGLPGQRPAPLSTLLVATWIMGIAAYTIARSISEHRFAVRMSQYVLPGNDLNHDIERLSHERPDQVATQIAHQLEVKSASLPILAASLILPVTLMYAFKAVRNWGWPSPNGFELAIATHSTPLIATAVLGLVTAIIMTRRGARVPRVASVAAVFAAIAAFMVLVSYVEWTQDRTWSLFAPGFVAAMVAITVRRLRIERTQIAAVDPAAGSEIFTVRGFFRKLRAGIAAVNAALTLDNARRALRATRNLSPRVAVVAIALIAAGTYGAMNLLDTDPANADVQVINGDGIDMKSAPSEASTWSVSKSTAGQFDVTVTLGDLYEVEIPSLAGIENIPDGWELSVTIRAYETYFADDSHAVVVTPVLDAIVAPQKLSNRSGSVVFTIDNCDNMSLPLGLRIRPHGQDWEAGDVIRLTVEPQLRVATCPNSIVFE